jgi:phosphatidylglycerophosphate synthase
MTRATPGRAAPPAVLLVAAGRLPPGTAELVGARAVAESGVLLGSVAPEDLGPALRGVADERSVVVVDAGWLTVPTVYGDLVADPRSGAAVLSDAAGAAVAVRLPAGTVAPVGDRLPTAGAIEALANRVRGAGPVREVGNAAFPAVRVGADLAEARASVDVVDEQSLRLRRASRSDDGFLSHFLVRPLSRRLTRRAVHAGVAPATITAVSLALGLGSAAAYTRGSPAWLLAGSLLLLCSLVVDCVDGEVARYTRTFSALGGWLDVASDRVKEYAVYAGLAVGAAVASGQRLWGLALAAMALLVVRHAVDFGFAASPGAETSSESPLARLSASTAGSSALMWAKRAVILPVGERTLVLIVLVPLAGAGVALWVLLGWGLLAGVYTTAGRVGRVWRGGTGRPVPRGVARLAAQCDCAPVPAGVLGLSRRWGWLVPAGSRAAEAAAVAALAWLAAGQALLPGAFALLGVAAFRSYDVVYRQRLARAVEPGDGLAWFGWPLRVVIVAAVAVAVAMGAAPTSGEVALLVVATLWGVAALVASARWWRRLPAGWVDG